MPERLAPPRRPLGVQTFPSEPLIVDWQYAGAEPMQEQLCNLLWYTSLKITHWKRRFRTWITPSWLSMNPMNHSFDFPGVYLVHYDTDMISTAFQRSVRRNPLTWKRLRWSNRNCPMRRSTMLYFEGTCRWWEGFVFGIQSKYIGAIWCHIDLCILTLELSRNVHCQHKMSCTAISLCFSQTLSQQGILSRLFKSIQI